MANTKSTWYELVNSLKDCTEAEALKMLDKEKKTTNRALWIERIYQRYSKLRREREHKHYFVKGR